MSDANNPTATCAAARTFSARRHAGQTEAEEWLVSECIARPAGLRMDVAWRPSEARAKQSVKVGNIGKARLQRDVGNSDLAMALSRQHHKCLFQPQLRNARGERCPG